MVKSRLHRERRLMREQIEHAAEVPEALRESTAGDLDRWAVALREKLDERAANEGG